MSTEQVSKRIVLLHSTGQRAGLCEILGVIEGARIDVMNQLRPSIPYGPDETQLAVHHKTHERYIMYREWAALPSGRFGDNMNPAQL